MFYNFLIRVEIIYTLFVAQKYKFTGIVNIIIIEDQCLLLLLLFFRFNINKTEYIIY